MNTGDEFDVVGMIRRARREADLSQRDLAAALGVSRATIARWETGRVCPTVHMMQAILRLAGLNLTAADAEGTPVAGMREDGLRDLAGKRRPAHLDVIALESNYVPRYDRPPQDVRVSWRPKRDQARRRCAAGLSTRGEGTAWVDGPDHPSARDIKEQLKRWSEQRYQRNAEWVRSQPSYQLWLEESQRLCCCPIECEENILCLPDCPCGCEPKTRTECWVG